MKLFNTAILASAFLFSSSAFAGLNNDVVSISLHYGFGGTTTDYGSAVIGNGVELIGGVNGFVSAVPQRFEFAFDFNNSGFTLSVSEFLREKNQGNNKIVDGIPNQFGELVLFGFTITFQDSDITDWSYLGGSSSGYFRYSQAQIDLVNPLHILAPNQLYINFPVVHATDVYNFGLNVAAVPEPSSYALMAAGIAFISLRRRKS